MMAEYIDREAAVKAFNNFDAGRADSPAFTLLTPEEFAEYLYELPAADVAPVRHGHWIGEGDGYADGELVFDVWYCSECDYCIDDGTDDPERLPKYCPGCGALMDGGNGNG